MRNYVVRTVRIRGKTVIVSAQRRDGMVKVEAARAVDKAKMGATTMPNTRIFDLPYGTAILSSANFSVCNDSATNRARLAHAMMCCCSAVMSSAAICKRGCDTHGKEKV